MSLPRRPRGSLLRLPSQKTGEIVADAAQTATVIQFKPRRRGMEMRKNALKTIATVAAILVCATVAAQSTPPLEFKGLSPGGDATPLLTHAAWTCQAKQLSGSDTVCFRKHETIAGADVQLVMVGIKEGKILSVYIPFAQTDFGRVHEALVLKYGQPAKSRKDVKTTRMGAEFTSLVAEWRQQSIYMKLEERSGKVDQSTLYLTSEASTRASAEQRSEQAQKNKGDL